MEAAVAGVPLVELNQDAKVKAPCCVLWYPSKARAREGCLQSHWEQDDRGCSALCYPARRNKPLRICASPSLRCTHYANANMLHVNNPCSKINNPESSPPLLTVWGPLSLAGVVSVHFLQHWVPCRAGGVEALYLKRLAHAYTSVLSVSSHVQGTDCNLLIGTTLSFTRL